MIWKKCLPLLEKHLSHVWSNPDLELFRIDLEHTCIQVQIQNSSICFFMYIYPSHLICQAGIAENYDAKITGSYSAFLSIIQDPKHRPTDLHIEGKMPVLEGLFALFDLAKSDIYSIFFPYFGPLGTVYGMRFLQKGFGWAQKQAKDLYKETLDHLWYVHPALETPEQYENMTHQLRELEWNLTKLERRLQALEQKNRHQP